MAAPAMAEKSTAAKAPTLEFILRGADAAEDADAEAEASLDEPEGVELVEGVIVVPKAVDEPVEWVL
jgi:hypothetical protein